MDSGENSSNNNKNNIPDDILLQRTAETLQQWYEKSQCTTTPLISWVRGTPLSDLPAAVDDNNNDNSASTTATTTATPRTRFFDCAGFVHVPQFCTAEECAALKQAMADAVEREWHPEQGDGWDSFGTSNAQNTARGDYFLESADKIHYFAEPEALLTSSESEEAANGDSSASSPPAPPRAQKLLKPEYYHNKMAALNKAGHGMHMIPNTAFATYCTSDQVRALVRELGWQDPVVPQSMYIFKQAVTGGAVNSHQDSTFLFTTPRQTCLGLWLALDDATLENGCLWVRPGSHQEPIRRQYCRNPVHFGAADQSSPSESSSSSEPAPKFIMLDLDPVSQQAVPWDGSLPGDGSVADLLEAGFIPVPCQAGDLLAFNGALDHLSLPNTSDRPRHTFQLHLVEGPRAGITWSPTNWLQYPAGKPFLRLFPEENDDENGRDDGNGNNNTTSSQEQ